jgi:hypothetical protein
VIGGFSAVYVGGDRYSCVDVLRYYHRYGYKVTIKKRYSKDLLDTCRELARKLPQRKQQKESRR